MKEITIEDVLKKYIYKNIEGFGDGLTVAGAEAAMTEYASLNRHGWTELNEQTMPKKTGEYFGLYNDIEKCFIHINAGKVFKVSFSNCAQFAEEWRDMTKLNLKILLDATTK